MASNFTSDPVGPQAPTPLTNSSKPDNPMIQSPSNQHALDLNPDKLHNAIEKMVKIASKAVELIKNIDSKRSGIGSKYPARVPLQFNSENDDRMHGQKYDNLKDVVFELSEAVDNAVHRFDYFHDHLEQMRIDLYDKSQSVNSNESNIEDQSSNYDNLSPNINDAVVKYDYQNVDDKIKKLVKTSAKTMAEFNGLEKISSSRPTVSTETKLEDEMIVGHEVNSGNVFVSENVYIPARDQGEIKPIYVGYKDTRRYVFAVTGCIETNEYVNRDCICIYNDIITGKMMQKIYTHRPSHLTVLHIREFSYLAFLENRKFLNIMVYHGMSDFVLKERYELPESRYEGLTAVTLPHAKLYECPFYYLIASTKTHLTFFKAIMEGDCGFDFDIDCNSILQ